MKKNETGIMVVTRFEDGYVVSGPVKRVIKFGETEEVNTDYPVYENAVATLKENPYPYAAKYLRVRALSEPIPVVRNEARFFMVGKVEVLEEIELSELRKEPEFDAACIANEKKHNEFENWFDQEMKELQFRTEVEERLRNARSEKQKIILMLLVIFVLAGFFWLIRNM